MNALLRDLQYSVRTLLRTPGFTAVAVLTLALALGVNSAVFSLLNAAILKPVVSHDPNQVVSLYNTRQGAARDYRRFSLAEFNALRTTNDVFSAVAAVVPARANVGVQREDSVQRSLVQLTSENYFALLGTTPAQGRFFTAAEARVNSAAPVAVASHALWQRLGARSDFLGSTLWINGRACTIVGITREGFSGTSAVAGPELWLPLGLFSQVSSAFTRTGTPADLERLHNHSLLLIGRLHSKLTLDSAASRLGPLNAELTRLHATADDSHPREVQLSPLSRFALSTQPPASNELALLATPLLVLTAGILLIACLNLANMLLARASTRGREIGVRLALGAARVHIVRQLLLEGLLLSLAGGALGLLLSEFGNQAVIASLDAALRESVHHALALDPRPDATVLLFTFGACAVATLLFSLAPALRASRRDIVSALKSDGADSSARWNRFFTTRHVLVMSQIALSMVLLFTAVLFFRGAVKAANIPLGFDPAGGLVTEIDFTLRNTAAEDDRRQLATLVERLAALPGVEHAAATTQAPMNNAETSRHVLPAEQSTEPAVAGARPGTSALFAGVTPDYFATVGVPLLRGRDFSVTESRDAAAPPVVILDASLAAKLFPAGDALGRRVRFAEDNASANRVFEVVGIVGEHRHEILEVESTHRVFVPLVRGYRGTAYLQTRWRTASPEALLAAGATVRAELQRFDATLPVVRHEPFADFIDRDNSLWFARLGAVIFGVFGAIALLLAVIGVYSVKAYTVASRTREFGIRVAIGARPVDILQLVLREGARQIAFAVGAGLLLALAAGQGLTALLFHVSPADPIALGSAAAVLGAATLLACLIPAQRATRVSPLTALRAE